MNQVLNEITPQDTYIVTIQKPISMEKLTIILDLYQPIIGTEAVNFYLTLLNHIHLGQIGNSEISLHRNLMGKMSLSFKIINKSRKVLEAIGLLKTVKYKHKETDELLYEYRLNSPLTALRFFQSDILSVLLLNRIGKTQYQLVKQKLLPSFDSHETNYQELVEITKSFDEIFDAILTSELKNSTDSEYQELLYPPKGKDSDKAENTPRINRKYLDLDFIEGMVSDIFQLHHSFDRELKALLQELAYLYHFTELDIIGILKDPTIYANGDKIDQQALRQRAKEKYQYQQKNIVFINKDDKSRKLEEPEITDKAKRHKWMLEHYSPIQLLQKYQNGGKIPDTDVAIIDELLYDHNLPSSVVNVLIEYVMLTNDFKLPKKLTEKIAGHWKRLKIANIEEALAVAKKEHQLYKEWEQGGQKTKGEGSNSTKKPRTTGKGKKEQIPDYILKQEEKYRDTEKEKQVDKKTKDEINQLLKELGEI